MKPLLDPTDPLIQRLSERSAELKPVRDSWRLIVGETASNHSKPVALDQGVLTVWVDSSLWASKLRHQGPSLVAKLQSHLSDLRLEISVTTLSIRVSPSEIQYPENSKNPIREPAGHQTTDLLTSVASCIKDGALRNSMKRLCDVIKDPSAQLPNDKKKST